MNSNARGSRPSYRCDIARRAGAHLRWRVIVDIVYCVRIYSVFDDGMNVGGKGLSLGPPYSSAHFL